MHALVTLARWEVAAFLGGLFGIVLWKLFTGGISLSYLLDAGIPDASHPGSFRAQASTGRTQLLVVTLIVAAYCVVQMLKDPTAFPHVPGKIIAGLGGSQALYLAAKAWVMRKGR